MDSPDKTPSRLQRHARIFRALAALAAAISLIAVVSQLLVAAAPLWKGGPVGVTSLNVVTQLALSMPIICYVVGLIRARSVFTRIGRGELFARENGKGLRAVGIALLIGALWAMAAAGLDDSYAHDVFGLHATRDAAAQIALAALGLALIMIGRVMAAAAALKTDNDRFV